MELSCGLFLKGFEGNSYVRRKEDYLRIPTVSTFFDNFHTSPIESADDAFVELLGAQAGHLY